MTLSDRKVLAMLDDKFVCGWKNIADESWAGTSTRHYTSAPAKTINTCSGQGNVQMFFMTSDARVLQCLPGFWQAEDLLDQVELVDKLAAIYASTKLTTAEKNEQFMLAQLAHCAEHDAELRYGSQLQGFDTHTELAAKSDFVRTEGPLKGGLKTTDQIVHERMAERPFLPFSRFDTANFVHFGQKHYEYHLGQHTAGKQPESKPARPTLTR